VIRRVPYRIGWVIDMAVVILVEIDTVPTVVNPD
jgi:hypothetical protein